MRIQLPTARLPRWIALAVAVPLIAWSSRLFLDPDPAGQLAFLDAALEDGAADRMQELFPEGELFIWSLDGLAWVELGLSAPQGSPVRGDALEHARVALARTDQPGARATFDRSLDPPYGVFYVGWTTLLRAGVVRLGGDDERVRLAADVEALQAAFDRSSTPFLVSYAGSAWPADSVVAQAALAEATKVLAPDRAPGAGRWLAEVRTRLDPATKLVPHAAFGDGPPGAARGSSTALMLRFWPVIDSAFAVDQFARLKRHFLSSRLGFPVVFENAGGGGTGDIDSGPLVWGVSLPASAVAIGAARVNGDPGLSEALRHTADLVGVRFRGRYLGGVLPVGDAFLAWSTTARSWEGAAAPPASSSVSVWWRLPVTTFVLVACAGLFLVSRPSR